MKIKANVVPVFPSLSGLSMGNSGMVFRKSSNMDAALSLPYAPKICSGFCPLDSVIKQIYEISTHILM